MIGFLLLALPAAQDPGADFFEANIRPLFAEHCTKCHGDKKQKAELRLDRYGSIMEGGEGGAVITPGEVDSSKLLIAVRYEDEFLQMPPRNPLSEAEIKKLEEWVEMGAPGPVTEGAGAIEVEEFDLEARLAHWAYQPVSDPKAPPSAWGTDSIDAFIVKSLSEADLEPAPETDRATWLRRVSYGITGLPPTSFELDEFLADDSGDAHERVVDRLLASPHYGEKWARHWLDLVRYGESRGHEFDYVIPNAYEYRDYLTRALNADVPYDRFLSEHVAGDLVEEPRLHPTEGYDESVLGTGFWHLGEEVHSPVDIRGDESDRVANQIEVFSRTFLAMSVSCARCHDHKFDPIPTEDYYALAGFLHSSSYRQVPFQSLYQNTRVAEELSELASMRGPSTRRAFARALQPSLKEVDEYLLAAREVLSQEGPKLDKEEPLPPGLELIFEDFEGGAWGAWEVEGDAFGEAPPLISDIQDYHKVKLKAWRGDGFVCTHRLPRVEGETSGNPTPIDGRMGRLKSPEFTVEHDHLHFLVCGGDDASKTSVNLVVGEEVVHTRAGSKDAVFRPASFDMSKWRGERARIEVVDEGGGGWGHIAVDHFVFSDSGDSVALERALSANGHREQVVVATLRDLDYNALSAWVQAINTARQDSADPLHSWAKVCDGTPLEAKPKPALWSPPPEAEVLFSYEDTPLSAAWIQDGNLFGAGPRAQGAAPFGADPSWPLDRVSSHPGAYVDPTWAKLEFGFGVDGFIKSPSSATPGSVLNWTLSGRTLRTPTFVPKHGKVHYLVRGAGRCFAAIDSHRIIAGPLHGQSIKRFEGQGDWRWETQDLTRYVGHRVHLEFTPVEGVSGFAVALITEGDKRPPNPPRWNFTPEGDDAVALATSISASLDAAVSGLTASELPPGEEGRDLAELLDWIVLHPELFPKVDRAALARTVTPHMDRRVVLLNSIGTRSRTAPAMIDGSGVNERVFIRGNHTTPGEIAPRRLPTALPNSEPIDASGSGRLELAHRLTKRENPLVARVMVNRIWHHLFGRGIVSSVDDFGKQGTRPTHPELLDHLATRFVDEGWSMKGLVRDIVLSATYRQSIEGDLQGREVDPDNLLLGRAPVRRLEAEAIRDGALAVSGALDRELYGPSVPVHLDPFMEGRGRPGKSGPIDGKNRRSLYISVPRNFLSPFFKVFDRPIPFTTQGRRSVSNVPAQSLPMMNNPLFEELAERWAKRVFGVERETPDELIESLYLEAFSRRPTQDETERLVAFLDGRDDEAAWADVCHVLFNVKEFIYLN